MKKRRRLNSKQMVKKSLLLFTMAIAFLATLVLSLTGTENLFSGRTDKNAAGQVPAHKKERNPNNDGTYKLSLDVVGDITTIPAKANVVVIFDTSGSMSNNNSYTGTAGYVPTTETGSGNTYYGLVNGEFVRIYRRGSGSNVYFTLTDSNTGTRYTGTRYTYVSNMNRLQAAKSAVTKLADSLYANNTEENDDIIEMALVKFGFNSSIVQNPTKSASTFSDSVIGLTATGATNWEAALASANQISFGDDDPTYVIFVSDGNPTVRNTKGDYNPFALSDNNRYPQDNLYYDSNGVYGLGSDNPSNNNYSAESMTRCYDQAVDEAQAIVSGGKIFYTIGIYGNVSRMQDLTTASGTTVDHFFEAKDTAGLNQAFDTILANISQAGIGEVTVQDGTTNKVVQTSGVVANLLTVDKTSFKYYIDGEEVTNLPTAELNDLGEVVWDLSSVGLLENGKKYTVTFDVWPSQYTYDLIADLKNGKKSYDSLDSEIKKYLHKDEDNYTLDTNTFAKLYYDDTRTEEEEIPVDYNTLNSVATTADKIRVSKDWENSVDETTHPIPDSIGIGVNKDTNNYFNTTLEKSKNFVSDEVYISTGLMRVKYTDNTNTTISSIEVLEDGHDYYFSELGEESYNWELVTEVVHPMLLNGELKKLIMVDEYSSKLYSINKSPAFHYEIPEGMSDDDEFYQDSTGTYFRINGNVYILTDDDPNILAYNYRRSNLNIKKEAIDGDSAPEDALFTFNIDVHDAGIGENDELWFSVYDNGFVDLGENLLTNDWVKRENADGIYYHAKNGTNLKVKLKKGQNLRFVNLTTNAHYKIVEENLPEGFSFKESSLTGWYGDDNGRALTGPDELDFDNSEDATIEGNISMTNSAFYAYFTNKYELVNVDVTKVWDDNDDEYDVRPDKVTVQLLADGVAMDDKIVDLIPNSDGTWPTFTYTDLPRYSGEHEIEYTVQEVEPDENYVSTITGSQENGKASYTITNTLKIKVNVEKVWKDDGDRDKIRPTEITVNLLANGKATGQSKTLNAGNNWKDTFTGLNKKEAGQDIEYTIEEVKVDKYDTKITGSQKDGYVITNTYEPEKTQVSVEKKWEDDGDRDRIRPTSITVNLLANGKATGKSTTLSETLGWSFTFTGLNKKEAGQDIKYTIEEVEVEQYESVITGSQKDGYVITNTYEPEKTEVSVEKKWEDDGDRDRIRPTSITVNLLANGKATGQSKTLNAGNNWKDTFTGLNKKEAGQDIEYTIEEVKVDKYDTKITGSQKDGYVITNTYEPEKTEVSVEKKWEDDGDRDRIRPTSITVNLLANGKATGQSKTLNAGNNWKDTFTGLNKKEAGQDIEYTIEEVEVEQYESVITGSQKDGYVITNTHTPEKIKELIGQKVWLDSNDKDGLRAKSITVELYADGDPTGITYTTDADKDWKYTFTNLDVYKGGNKIKYTVREHAFENQDLYDTDYDDDKLTVINSHEVKSKEISVKKVWKDDDNKYGRPGSVKVTLYGKVAGENVIEPQEETLSNDNNWTYTFKDLPTYKDGKLITYSVDEANVLDYSKAITGNETEGFVITNTYAPATIDIKGKKTWEDVDDQDGIRPKSITVHVLDHLGKEVASQEVHGPDWTFEFKGLVKFANGEKIDYTVEEVSVPDDYNADVKPVVDEETTEESNLLKYEVINTHTPETVSYTITKKWEDLENNDGKRPDSITVQLKVDGNVNKEITIGEEDGWTYTFDNLPKYDHGREIKYEIVESAVDGYEAEYSMVVDENDENSFSVQITNTHEIEKTEVPVVKTWNDNDNKDNTRPSEITVNLYADGELIDTVKITDEMNWTYTFKDLLKFKDGKEIVYTIEEEAVEGYETVIEGFNITNTYIPKPAEKKILPPQTGFENNMNLHYILFAFISAILLLRKRIA